MELRLGGDEASDYLNFVVKDEGTGTWYDLNGTNFQVGAVVLQGGYSGLVGGCGRCAWRAARGSCVCKGAHDACQYLLGW